MSVCVPASVVTARGPLGDSAEPTPGAHVSLWAWVAFVPVEEDVLIHREDTEHGLGAFVRSLAPTGTRASGEEIPVSQRAP